MSRWDDLVADTSETYVNSACELARDTARLQTLRSSIRERISTSPLCDARAYALRVEAAYRDMWRTWCAHAEDIS